MRLYHATFEALLPSIQKHGLIPGGMGFRNFEWSENGIYFAESPDQAESFIECSENEGIESGQINLGGIVVVAVERSSLDCRFLESDPQWHCEEAASWRYRLSIPPEWIEVESQPVT